MTVHSIQYKIVKTFSTDEVVELYKEGGWWIEGKWSREIIPAMVESSFCFMVALEGDRPIGMGRVISDGHSDGYIQDVVVRKSHRGHGIGGELIKRLTKYCVDQKLEWIALLAEPNTCEFYEKYGYRAKKDYQLMVLEDIERYE